MSWGAWWWRILSLGRCQVVTRGGEIIQSAAPLSLSAGSLLSWWTREGFFFCMAALEWPARALCLNRLVRISRHCAAAAAAAAGLFRQFFLALPCPLITGLLYIENFSMGAHWLALHKSSAGGLRRAEFGWCFFKYGTIVAWHTTDWLICSLKKSTTIV